MIKNMIRAVFFSFIHFIYNNLLLTLRSIFPIEYTGTSSIGLFADGCAQPYPLQSMLGTTQSLESTSSV